MVLAPFLLADVEENPDISALAGRPFKLKFYLKNAELFAIRFAD
jgi:hypothetical protein